MESFSKSGCAAFWTVSPYLHIREVQQLLGVPAQDAVLFLLAEGQGADGGHGVRLALPGAVGAEQDAVGAEGADHAEELLLYRWNRLYPADLTLNGTPVQWGYRLQDATDFAGTSHEKITRERYVKKERA